MSIKRLTAGFLGIALSGMLITTCEKMNGPLPEVSEYRGQLLLLDGSDAPLVPPIQINTLQKLIINDAGFAAYRPSIDTIGGAMVTLKKIVFQ